MDSAVRVRYFRLFSKLVLHVEGMYEMSPNEVPEVCSENVKDKMTILLVTSPILSHPNTELLDRVVSSFSLVESLCSCQMLLLADGVKCGKFRPKRGIVPAEMVIKYNLYLNKLEELARTSKADSIWSRTKVIRLEEHMGFGHVVLRGLKEARTEYVLVVQHDHPFSKQFSINPVLQFMDITRSNYVSLPISTVWRHVNRCSSLYQINLREKSVDFCNGRFIPILFWYDGTHVARRDTYIKLVFEGEQPLPVGHFIEDTFSQRAMGLLRENYQKWFPVFSTYVYQPEVEKEEALIFHLDGRNYRTDKERKNLGWGNNPGGHIEEVDSHRE